MPTQGQGKKIGTGKKTGKGSKTGSGITKSKKSEDINDLININEIKVGQISKAELKNMPEFTEIENKLIN